ncbi:AGE family epimerase/isomerase [Spirochaeta dissipatitropha]
MEADKKQQQNLTKHAANYQKQLYSNTLPFWLKHGMDSEHGGIITGLGRRGELLESDKSVWFQGRAGWTFATAYRLQVDKDPELLKAAASVIDFSDRHCYDRDGDGRMYFRVTRQGRPLIKRRYFFSECFAAIAKSAYGSASGSTESLDQAFRLFESLQHFQDDPAMQNPKVEPRTRPSIGLALPMIEINIAQELRESALNLEGPASQRVHECSRFIRDRIELIEKNFIKEDLCCVLEQTGPNGEFQSDHFEGRLVNPGHSIELAWFILREADFHNDPALGQTGCRILDWMLESGWDNEYGGLYYFLDAQGKPPFEYWHNMKFWWPHNEAVIACLYATLLNEGAGRQHYLKWFERIHDWNEAHFPDRESGEWFGYLNRDGSVSTELKGNMFKGPFHLPRMQMYAWQLLQRLITQNNQSFLHNNQK